jgi:hypothetical protein
MESWKLALDEELEDGTARLCDAVLADHFAAAGDSRE